MKTFKELNEEMQHLTEAEEFAKTVNLEFLNENFDMSEEYWARQPSFDNIDDYNKYIEEQLNAPD